MFANLDDSHVTVVMYSKFSKSCTKFLEILEKVPTFKHTLLCIDNEEARKRVLSPQSKLNVSEVPCIFRIYERTGYVESFEGDRAFTILNTHYNHYLEKLEKEQLLRATPPTPPQQMPQMPQMQQMPQISQLPQMQQQMPMQQQMSQISQHMTQQQMAQMPPPQQMTQIPPQQVQMPPQQQMQPQQVQMQPVSYDFDITSQPPPTTMSSTPIDQLEPYMSSNPLQNDRAVKSSTVNIVSRAMQMQKERDSDAPATKRPQ